MKTKRIFSVLSLIFIIASLTLSLSSCGDSDIEGISVTCTYSNEYNETSDVTSLFVTVYADNENPSRSIINYSYKLIFKSAAGHVLATKICDVDMGIIEPSNTDVSYQTFNETDGEGIRGNVAYVEVIPVKMNISNKESKPEDDTDFNESWGLFEWAYVIICAGIIFHCIGMCIDSDGDGGEIFWSIVKAVVGLLIVSAIFFNIFYDGDVEDFFSFLDF